jgi:hypothetical protein|uniref:Minor capsid protein P9 transmembrane helices domain-containing protein n=1 Tax=viral metagenome TaxID=1070528 RepID=A0A6C0INF8_9ZZZZ
MNSSLPSAEIEYEETTTNKHDDSKPVIEENKESTENFCEARENMETRDKNKDVPFWSENPNILLQQEYVFEFYPVESMSYPRKLNAISRVVVLLALVVFLYSSNFRILLVGIITMMAVYVLHYFHMKEIGKKEAKRIASSVKENFASPSMDYLRENSMPIPTDVFDTPDSSNPFGNVLVTDYDYKPDKKPAPPAYNKIVEADIMKQAKQLVNEANPDHPDIADKLFGDMGSNLEFEQSLRPFNSTPNTMIPNDQGAFAEFCYGSMISCKEGNDFACARNLARHIN